MYYTVLSLYDRTVRSSRNELFLGFPFLYDDGTSIRLFLGGHRFGGRRFGGRWNGNLPFYPGL
jgi:hypothetical protein